MKKEGKKAESLARSMDVGTNPDHLKGSRPGEERDGEVGECLPAFKGTRVGRDPDRKIDNVVGSTKPER